MLRIAICDDENKDIEKLESHINEYMHQNNYNYECFKFQNSDLLNVI